MKSPNLGHVGIKETVQRTPFENIRESFRKEYLVTVLGQSLGTSGNHRNH